MIELRDVVIFAFAAGGAYMGTRIDVRALWRAVRELTHRVTHLERQSMKPRS